MDDLTKQKIGKGNLDVYAGKQPKHNKPSYYKVRGFKLKYNNPNEERLAAIERLLSNSTRDAINNKQRQLSKEQIKTLLRYKEDYSNTPSPRGGKNKVASVYASMTTLREVGLYLKKPFEKATKEDLKQYIKYLNDNNKAVTSISRLKVTIRSFYKWMYGIKEKHKFPEVVDDPVLVPEATKSTKRKIDMPTKEDIVKLVNACYSTQHKALLMVLAESGARCEEITSANIESVSFDDRGIKLFTEKSKSKERYIRLIHSVPFLEAWLKEHPYKSDSKAPLFISFRRGAEFTGKRLNPKAISEMIKRIQKRVPELKDKRLHAHILRHFAITTRWNEGMRTETNALRHGITTETLRKVYLHYDDKEADEEYSNLQGVKKSDIEMIREQEERQRLAPKKCEYCGAINPFNNSYCSDCSRPLDVTTFIKVEEEQTQKVKQLEDSVEDIKKSVRMLLKKSINEKKR
jgi:integrase/recombinase XerD